MMNYIIGLVGSLSPMWSYVLTPIMCLAFVATVPCILREMCRINV